MPPRTVWQGRVGVVEMQEMGTRCPGGSRKQAGERAEMQPRCQPHPWLSFLRREKIQPCALRSPPGVFSSILCGRGGNGTWVPDEGLASAAFRPRAPVTFTSTSGVWWAGNAKSGEEGLLSLSLVSSTVLDYLDKEN